MLINDELKKQNMTKYRLSKDSGVPQATINDICSGKAEIEKCTAGTLYRLAKVLGLTVEDILQSAKDDYRENFETFKSNTCHHVKDMGDLDFIADVLKSDRVRVLYDRKWYPEALYLLAMLDYLSEENNIPLCTKYNDIRMQKLEKPVFPIGVLLAGEVLKSDEPLRKAEQEAIPVFRRFNIIESEIRNVVWYDLSDVIGVLWEQENKGAPITVAMVKEAAENLYGSYELLPEDSRVFFERVIIEGKYEQTYQRVRQMEAENKDILLQFQEEYPSVTNTDNVNEILATIRRRKEGK